MTFSRPGSRGGAITPPPPGQRYSGTYRKYEVSPIASETQLLANGPDGHQGGRSMGSGSSVGDHRRHSSFSRADHGPNEFVRQSYQVPREATRESHSTSHQKKTAPSRFTAFNNIVGQFKRRPKSQQAYDTLQRPQYPDQYGPGWQAIGDPGTYRPRHLGRGAPQIDTRGPDDDLPKRRLIPGLKKHLKRISGKDSKTPEDPANVSRKTKRPGLFRRSRKHDGSTSRSPLASDEDPCGQNGFVANHYLGQY